MSSHPESVLVARELELVGLGARLDYFRSQLSGGEQQRVAIAKQPDLLMCDEPTGALEAQTGRMALQVIARINRELGTTTAIITHNAPIAAMADRVQSHVSNQRKLDASDRVAVGVKVSARDDGATGAQLP